jgi:hypothetical protein
MSETAKLEPALKRKYEEYIDKGLGHEAALFHAEEDIERLNAIKHSQNLRATHKVGTPPTLYKGTDPGELRDINYLKRQVGR